MLIGENLYGSLLDFGSNFGRLCKVAIELSTCHSNIELFMSRGDVFIEEI